MLCVLAHAYLADHIATGLVFSFLGEGPSLVVVLGPPVPHAPTHPWPGMRTMPANHPGTNPPTPQHPQTWLRFNPSTGTGTGASKRTNDSLRLSKNEQGASKAVTVNEEFVVPMVYTHTGYKNVDDSLVGESSTDGPAAQSPGTGGGGGGITLAPASNPTSGVQHGVDLVENVLYERQRQPGEAKHAVARIPNVLYQADGGAAAVLGRGVPQGQQGGPAYEEPDEGQGVGYIAVGSRDYEEVDETQSLVSSGSFASSVGPPPLSFDSLSTGTGTGNYPATNPHPAYGITPVTTFPIIIRWFPIQIAYNIGNVVKTDKVARANGAKVRDTRHTVSPLSPLRTLLCARVMCTCMRLLHVYALGLLVCSFLLLRSAAWFRVCMVQCTNTHMCAFACTWVLRALSVPGMPVHNVCLHSYVSAPLLVLCV